MTDSCKINLDPSHRSNPYLPTSPTKSPTSTTESMYPSLVPSPAVKIAVENMAQILDETTKTAAIAKVRVECDNAWGKSMLLLMSFGIVLIVLSAIFSPLIALILIPASLYELYYIDQLDKEAKAKIEKINSEPSAPPEELQPSAPPEDEIEMQEVISANIEENCTTEDRLLIYQ